MEKSKQLFKKFAVVDLFCGVGGLTRGMLDESLSVVAGLDFDESCRYAYEKNNNAVFIHKDICQFSSSELMSLYPANKRKILVGCAPCQPFSIFTQSKRSSNYHSEDNKWKLLYEFGRLICETRPEIISMENVPILKTFDKGLVFKDFVSVLIKNGYFVHYDIYNAQYYGTPQRRKRLILLASLHGPINMIAPTHNSSNFITVEKAIGHLPEIKAGEICKTDPLHRARNLTKINLERLINTKEGGSWTDWQEDEILECHKRPGGKLFRSVYGRMSRSDVAPTITTYCIGINNGRFGHPTQNRALSLREAALLQSFPEKYQFIDPKIPFSMHRVARHIGNSVPVSLGKAIAMSIKNISMTSMSKKNKLKWRFDVNTFRLIGRDLITDRITAVYELVKNCYDANATSVHVILSTQDSSNKVNFINIIDNGHGMSFSDVKDKWMVIGTNSKRVNQFSPKPFNRKFVGEKGIGRFAVDKLGSRLVLKTKQENTANWLEVTINWDEYEKISNSNKRTLFTEIGNTYDFVIGESSEHGTSLLISNIRDEWTKNDIDKLYRELSKIVSPFHPLDPPFNIYFTVTNNNLYTEKLVESDNIRFASHEAILLFDENSKQQEILRFNDISGRFFKEKVEFKSFGPVEFYIYYFDDKAKKRFKEHYKNSDFRIDGVKIYRDGVITTPFAEYEEHSDKRRDILGIDKRLWRDIFNRISTRDVIGVLHITKNNNPSIIDATNRQDFVENREYKELKEFIIEQLDTISMVRIFERDENRIKSNSELNKARENIGLFLNQIDLIQKANPDFSELLQPLFIQAKKIDRTLLAGIEEQKKSQDEFTRKENIYLSLMSLQDYAIQLSHAVRTSLGKVLRMAEFLYDFFPDPKFNKEYKLYSSLIYDEMMRLNKAIDFMLSYAASNLEYEEFSIKKLLNDMLFGIYTPSFEKENIKVLLEIKDDLIIVTNKKFLEDIFENLISNSMKALSGFDNKIIKVSSYIEDQKYILLFSDNGVGVPASIRHKIFEMYFTTTADEGGSGLGLYIVRTRIDSLQGQIEIIDSEFKNCGTTFKITLPLFS